MTVQELIDELNFNSTMVRLKAQAGFALSTNCRHFNSTMVRLKEQMQGRDAICIPISIPLWYD